MSQRFIDRMKNADPAKMVESTVFVDTNVVAEFDTLADLFNLSDKHLTIEDSLRSPEFRYRQYRLKHSVLLMWWFAKNKIVAGVLGNECIDLVTGRLAVPKLPSQYTVAKAIYHVVRPFVWQGWHVAAVSTVNHALTGTDADDELLRVASEDNVPVITWEGFTPTGFVANPKKLRDKCKARGVPVFTPAEYLAAERVDLEDQTRRFLFALNKGVREAHAKKILAGKNIVENLVPIYRLILLDEIDPAYGAVVRPPPTW